NAVRKQRGLPEVDAFEFLGLVRDKMKLMHIEDSFLSRGVNEGFSGGEKKRNEVLQMLVLEPRLAILDETDSGLDIDALKVVAAAGPTAARRRTALAALSAGGLPTSRDENWKYANLRPLERLRFVPAAPAQPVAATDLPAAIPGFARYVFVDGAFAPALSAPLNATAAAVTPLSSAG